MDDLKYLSDELKFRKDLELPLREYRLDPYGDFPSGRVIGYQKLNNDNLHLLCFNNGLYVFDLDHLVYHEKASPLSSFVAYLYLENFQGTNGECFPAHVFFKSDGIILFYRINLSTLKFSPVFISERGDFSVLNFQSITASSKNGIYISQAGKTIYKWSYFDPRESLGVFLPVERQPLQYSTFMLNDSIFLCVYKSVFNGDVFVEFSKHCSRTGIFKPLKRATLGNLDFKSVIIEKINDQLVLCVTSNKTWNFTSDLKVFQRKNKGLPNDAQFFSISWNSMMNSIRLHTSSDVFETTDLDIHLAKPPIRWSSKKIHSISSYSASMVDYSYELRENLYVIIYARGLVVLVNSSTLQSSVLKCDNENRSYFAGQIAANKGSDLNTVLLCGASGDRHGFFEKRFLQYPPCKRVFPFSKRLIHTPVTNLWSTKDGIFYESLGTIYNSDSDSDNGQDGIWVSKTGEVLKDADDETLFKESVASSWGDEAEEVSGAMSWERNTDYIATICANGVLELLKYTEESAPQKILQLQLGEWLNEATVVSACYNYRKKILHVAAFVDYRKIFYCDNRNKSFEIPVEHDFQVAGLQIIDNYVNLARGFTDRLVSNVLIVATSFDGRIRIYSMLNEKVILEIKSPQNSEFQMVKFFNFIIFHNAFEVILLRTCDLVYGNLPLPEIPYKIIHLKNNEICILDRCWNLQFLEISASVEKQLMIHEPEYQSQFYNFGDYLPLQMSLMPGSDNLVAMALKNYSNSAGLQLVLFDHINMKTVKSQEWDEVASGVLLVSYFNHLLLSYYKDDHSIVKIFDFHLKLIRRMSFDHRIPSLYFTTPGLESIRSGLRIKDCEEFTSGLPENIIENLCRHFNDPRNSKYRTIYETAKRPQLVTWHHGKEDEYQATDTDILIDFVEDRREPTISRPKNYKLHLTFNNHISIDDFKKLIPYEILSVSPIDEFIYNIQDGIQRTSYIRPLFLITCSHNAIYILSAKYIEPDEWK
ncbi:ZYRO0E03080p [Zygosaccharomyces rouxii]|uniref:ZYRO0E03080p n=1 Tax=Zygosaccharomyces rouxii (strain ATCC 2623 / CBS 732 / NBRC 1130 / NCYC 568 / NRRL Y-229) TaxID=559307 RepID=C5E459_ZYGRC|nr:uncharacterized protein ZYRO0E03080g [Zygosaccharomyces rouxii]KAH9198321.1 hypothetical protein LQ764DRAFT_157597 [Zygosaccharomyces rouxii]CAR30820.1 ZYRO0E03080p [Zygosaccharomyces rouxii]